MMAAHPSVAFPPNPYYDAAVPRHPSAASTSSNFDRLPSSAFASTKIKKSKSSKHKEAFFEKLLTAVIVVMALCGILIGVVKLRELQEKNSHLDATLFEEQTKRETAVKELNRLKIEKQVHAREEERAREELQRLLKEQRQANAQLQESLSVAQRGMPGEVMKGVYAHQIRDVLQSRHEDFSISKREEARRHSAHDEEISHLKKLVEDLQTWKARAERFAAERDDAKQLAQGLQLNVDALSTERQQAKEKIEQLEQLLEACRAENTRDSQQEGRRAGASDETDDVAR